MVVIWSTTLTTAIFTLRSIITNETATIPSHGSARIIHVDVAINGIIAVQLLAALVYNDVLATFHAVALVPIAAAFLWTTATGTVVPFRI